MAHVATVAPGLANCRSRHAPALRGSAYRRRSPIPRASAASVLDGLRLNGLSQHLHQSGELSFSADLRRSHADRVIEPAREHSLVDTARDDLASDAHCIFVKGSTRGPG